MAERRVDVRFSSPGFDEVIRNFEKLSLMIDKLSEKLDQLSLKFDKLSKKRITPEVDTKGLDKANASLDKLDLRLDKLSHKRVTATVKVNVDDKSVGKDLKYASRRIFGILHFSPGGSSGAASAAEEAAGSAAGGGGGGLFSALGGLPYKGVGIGALITAAVALAPSIIPYGLGLGVGGAGALGAYKLDKRPFDATLDQAKSAYLNAISNKPNGIFGGQPNLLPGVGEHGLPGPQGSFLGNIIGILSQIDRFIQQISPQLRDMFMASLPIMRSFVSVMEQFAKAALPAITQSLQQLKSTGALKILTQGFVILAKGIAGFITALGPGMKDSAIIFKATMVAVAAVLRFAGNAANWFAHFLINLVEGAKIFGHQTAIVWDKFRHETASMFDDLRHNVAHIWDSFFNDTLGTTIRNTDRIVQDFNNWSHNVAMWFDRTRHDASAIWDQFWSEMIRMVSNGTSTVVNFFSRLPSQIVSRLKSLGSELLSIGRGAISDMLHGMESVAGGLLSWVQNFVKNIWGDVKKFFGFGSPSRLFYNAGKNIVLGMAHGIKDHAHKAVSAARAMSAAVGGHVSGTAAGAQAYGRRLASAYGWAGQWSDINAVAMRESGWNPTARNPSSGAYGIAQFINGPSEYYQYGGNPNTVTGQVQAFFNYIRQRYGSPAGAWAHEMNFGWYDKGGRLPPGLSLALNTTGRDEIHTAGPGSSGDTYIFNLMQPGFTDAEALNLIKTLRKYKLRHHNQSLGIA